MGRIKNEELYILDQAVSGNDRLIGSDGDDLKKTKNFSVDDLLSYIQAQGFGVAPTYTEYVANITQSSTSAPTAVVLGNGLSGAIVWTRSGVGSYKGTLIGEFPVDKVAVTLGGNRTFPETTIRAYRSSDDEISIITNFQSGALDGVLNNTSIIIRVYP